jgi:dTMP kinase
VSGRLRPDLTLVFDAPVEVALARLPKEKRDRFESEDKAYFERVRAGYLERAAAEPGRMRVLESGRPMADVKKEVEDIIAII